MNKKYLRLLGAVAILGAGWGGWTYWSHHRSGANPSSRGNVATSDQYGGSDVVFTVEKKSFNSSLQKQGVVKIENEQKMKFASSGRITSVAVKQGQRVTKGQILASIDATSINNNVKSARRSLADARERLADFRSTFQDEIVAKAKQQEKDIIRQIDQKILDREQLAPRHAQDRVTQAQSLKQSEKNLRDAEQSYKDRSSNGILIENLMQQKLQEHYRKIEEHYDRLVGDNDAYDNVIQDIDKILNIYNINYKFPYSSQLGAKKPGTKQGAARVLQDVYARREKFDKQLKQVEKRDGKVILSLTEEQREIHRYFIITLDAVIDALDESISSPGFQDDDIGGYKKPLIAHKKTIENMQKNNAGYVVDIVQYNHKRNSVEEVVRKNSKDEIFSNDLRLRQAELALQNERTRSENLLKRQQQEREQMDEDIAGLRRDLRVLQKKNRKIVTLATNPEYKNLQASIEQAQGSLDVANQGYENYVLKAPFGGEVVEMEMRVGDIGDADDTYIAIVDPDAIRVTISLNQSEIDKIKPGMKAAIKVDAYKDVMFDGEVVSIDAVPGVDGGGLTFKATIVLKNTTDKKLYSGMTAGVEITLQKLVGSLVVPFTAVASDPDGRRYVTRTNQGQKEKVYVEVGYNDGKYYQITQGLKEGDTILEIDYRAAQETPKEEKDDAAMGGGMMEMQMESGMMY